jgi:hypothetical protein
MPQPETARRPVTDKPRALGRRALLMCVLLGGAAIGATTLSNLVYAAHSQQRQTPTAQTPPQEQWRQRDAELLKKVPVAHRRRLVTANNAEGKSYIVTDEIIADSSSIGGHMDLWATEPSQPFGPGPSSKIAGTDNLIAIKGGTRAYFATLPAGYNATATRENRQGMHRTLTIDYVYVLSGAVTMLMDVPPDIKLKAGDIVIQRNTMHSWRVDGPGPVTLLAFLARGDY